MWNNIASRVKEYDAYPKTLEDFRVKTFAGAAVTIISGLVMFSLFVSELTYFLTTEVDSELFVDMSRGDKLKINLDITFQMLPCQYITLDAMDVSGQRQINVHSTLYKQRLTKEGLPVDEEAEKITEISHLESNSTKPVEVKTEKPKNTVPECGSCYGAETDDMKCCNTCEDVRIAYNKKGWALPKGNMVVQCQNEDAIKDKVFIAKEGCQLHGYLEVNRVAGNFHISPGKSYEVGHLHVHDMEAFGSNANYNVTHTINHLSFGLNYPGQIHPLNNHTVYPTTSDMAYQYYIKIVPTTYVKLNSDKLLTNQFSVTKHQKRTSGASGEGSIPGVFISYELSSMMVRYIEKRRSFLHFLTSLCAIIGGVFTVAGLLDSFIYHGSKALKKKMELGKLT